MWADREAPAVDDRAPAGDRLNALSSMQLICLLLIVARHYSSYLADAYPAAAAMIGRIDFSEFFFLSSGFVTLAAAQRRGAGGHARFLRRQALRLYPLHVATTAFFAAAVLIAGMAGSLNGESLARCTAVSLLWLQAYGPLTALCLNYPSWFLSAIFGMYLVFPPLRRLVERAPVGAAVLAVAAAIGLQAVGTPVVGRAWTSWTYDFGVVRALPSFLGGMVVCDSARRHGWRIGTMLPAWALLVAAVGIMTAGAPAMIGKVAVQVALLIAIVAAERASAGGVLARPGVARWGRATFPLFLLHAPVAAVLMNVIAIRLLKLDGAALLPALAVTAAAALIAARLYAAAAARIAR